MPRVKAFNIHQLDPQQAKRLVCWGFFIGGQIATNADVDMSTLARMNPGEIANVTRNLPGAFV